MLIEPMIQQLHQLRLRGMAAGLEQLLNDLPQRGQIYFFAIITFLGKRKMVATPEQYLPK